MDQRREEAIQNYMATMPTPGAFIPAMVDACDLGAMGARRQELIEALSGGTFIPFDVPGSTFTAAWDVNPSGDVVGVYRDAAGFHGFLWAKLRFRAVDYPGATTTRAFGINSRGHIVGAYIDGNGRTHGFVASRTEHD